MIKIDKEQDNRLKTMAKNSYGDVLDIGYVELPNPYLSNPIGLDIKEVGKPDNYKAVYTYDGNEFPFEDNSFDSITAGELIEHIANIDLFLTECKRVLKPKGKLIFSTPNPFYISEIVCDIFNIRTNKEHINLFPRSIFKNLTELNGLELIKVLSNGLVIPIISIHLNIALPFLTKNYIYICKKNEQSNRSNN